MYFSFGAFESVLGLVELLQGTWSSFGASSRPLIEDPSSHVLPFIGTVGEGHVFPGATLPHGMVKVGMDVDSRGNHAGYDGDPSYRVLGFSQLHDDGTGGDIPLSNFKLFPIFQCESFLQCRVKMGDRKAPRKTIANGQPDDAASPGYFSMNFTTDIRVELTATRRTALHRYTFPIGTPHPRILLDVTNDGHLAGMDANITIFPHNYTILAGGKYQNSFGMGSYRAYTCVSFQGQGYDLPVGGATEFGTYKVDGIGLGNRTDKVYYGELGGLMTFPPNPDPKATTSILARVGISLHSSERACGNADGEISGKLWDFEGVRRNATAAWNKVLGNIQVDPWVPESKDGIAEADMEETVKLFYSSLYRSHISPADYTGENPNWVSEEPYFDSFYCNWDTYRTLFPLMSLHDPYTFARIVRGMIDIQKWEGWLPECRGATLQQWVQGGSNADPIISEFFVKYHKHIDALNVSSTDLYSALLADAEKQPPNYDVQGRQAETWKKFGYLPTDLWGGGGSNSRYVSRALEYAFDDFTIAQVAKILNRTEEAMRYYNRSRNFINNWNPETFMPDADAIKGFMQPRKSKEGAGFVYTDPRHCSQHDPTHSTCYLDPGNQDGFYEGSPIIYSQYVPHDTAKLIQMQGGPEMFRARLDFIFTNGYFESTNEPSQQMPYMYHYINKPGLSTQRSRQILAEFYNTSRNGLPGNDDSGAMGSYVAFYLLGMYPLPGTRQILLSSPFFREVRIYNPLYDSTTRIVANGFIGNPKSGQGGKVFVKSVKVNGQKYKSNCYLEWDVFEQGSLVELELTEHMYVTCGEGKDALPPSLSTGGYDL